MSITTAFGKLSPDDRKEAKSLMKDFIEQDGMEKQDAAKAAIDMMMADSETERDNIIKQAAK